MDLFVKCVDIIGKILMVICMCGLFWMALVITP